LFAALILSAVLAGRAAAQEPPKYGWAGDNAFPADLRQPLLSGAPDAMQANARFALTLLPDVASVAEFRRELKKNKLGRGFWLSVEAAEGKRTLYVWLIDEAREEPSVRSGAFGPRYDRPLDLACRLAWESLEMPLAPAAETLWTQARKAWRAGDLPAADLAFRQALIVTPHAEALCRDAGQMYLASGRPEAAIPWFRAALSRNPNDYLAWMWLARLYETTGADDEERQATEAALRVGPRVPSLLMTAAAAYKRAGRLHEAQALLVEAARRDPDDPDAPLALLNVAEINHDWPVAAPALRRVLETAGGGEDLWRELVDYQMLARDYAGAEQTIARLRQQHPNDESLFRDHILSLLGAGRYAEAEPQLAKFIEGRPDSAWAATAMGRLYYHTRRYDRAMLWFARAHQLDPGDEQLERLLAMSAELSGDKERALAYYEARLTGRSSFGNDELDHYVALSQELGHADRAETLLRRLMDSATGQTQRTAAAIALGQLLVKLGRPRDAIAAYQNLLRRRSRPPNVLFELGRLHFSLKEYDAGAAYFREFAAVSPDARRLAEAARLAEQAGDASLQIQLYAAAFAADPTATEVGVLLLEALLLNNVDRDNDILVSQLDPLVKQPDERELLFWLELFWAATAGHADYFAHLLPVALRFVAARKTTRVELSKWPPVVAARLAGPPQAEMADLMAVFARKLPAKDFARKYRVDVPGW
jgi:tetratricopeptide (TPR) repeat protein